MITDNGLGVVAEIAMWVGEAYLIFVGVYISRGNSRASCTCSTPITAWADSQALMAFRCGRGGDRRRQAGLTAFRKNGGCLMA
jgi:hypothetical protein